MTQERSVAQVGSVFAMLGAVITVVSFMLGPMGYDSHDAAAIAGYFADNAGRLQVHGLGVALGKLLLLGGFVALYRSLRQSPAALWAQLGLAAAIVTTVLNVVGPMVGGSVMPAVAQASLQVAAGDAAGPLQVVQGFYLFYQGLLGPTLLTLAAAVVPFAIAILRTQTYPPWIGWFGLVAGIWLVVGGFAFFLAGAQRADDIMTYFVPGFLLAIVWLFLVGVYLRRIA
jgi:hypothetical protein